MPIALQFVTFDAAQIAKLKSTPALPAVLEATIDGFHANMSDEELRDPAFSYRVAFVPKVGAKASKSDQAIEFIKADSDEGKQLNSVLLKEVDKNRYTPSQVVELMQANGFPNFKVQHHTALWQELSAKAEGKGFGKQGDYANTWVWFDSWVERVRAHCEENSEKYAA